MKTFLSFDDAGADDEHPAKDVTLGDIRAWHDAVEKARVALAALIPDPRNVTVSDWPVSNPADAECLQDAWEATSETISEPIGCKLKAEIMADFDRTIEAIKSAR